MYQSAAVGTALALAAGICAAQPAVKEPPKPAEKPAASTGPAAFMQEVPGAAYKFEMRPIPASADGSIKPFYMSTNELGWEAYDVFVFRLDEPNSGAPSPTGADATTRPSKPYLPPDRGFGHEGYAAISLTFKGADEFCKWLSGKSGRKYRLATEAEWEHAARAGAAADAMLPKGVAKETLGDAAVCAENSDAAPKPVGGKAANAYGLHDMLGNVAEWCVDKDGKGVTKGGSFKTPLEELSIAARQPFDKSWNASDPQMPKSKWWLPDAPFVGFRVVCEMSNGMPAKTEAPAK